MSNSRLNCAWFVSGFISFFQPLPGIHSTLALQRFLKCLGLAETRLSPGTYFVINKGGWKMGKYLPKVSESIMRFFECLDKRGECDGKWLVAAEWKKTGRTFTQAIFSQICQALTLSLKPYPIKSVKINSVCRNHSINVFKFFKI